MTPTPFGDVFIYRAKRAMKQLQTGSHALSGSKNAKAKGGFASIDCLITMTQARAFVAVVEHGGFSVAGRVLGLEQPTVHRGAREVELLARDTLFERVGSTVRATRAGTMLARRLKLAFIEIQQAFDEVAQLKGTSIGNITIGVQPLVRTYSELIPLTTVEVTSSHGDLNVEIVDGSYTDLFEMLKYGKIDLIIGSLRGSDPGKGFLQEILFTEAMCVVARSGHPLAGKRKVSVEDILDCDWVVATPGTPARTLFEGFMERIGHRLPENVVESRSFVAKQWLMKSDRLTLMSRRQILEEERSGILSVLKVEAPGAIRPIGLTMRSDWHPTQLQAAFLASLRKNAEMIIPEQDARTFALVGIPQEVD